MRCSQMFILSLFLIVMTSCCDVKKKKKSDMLDSLVGRDVSFVDSLLVFKEKNRPRVFMICSVFDCGPCLNSAFVELKILDNLLFPSSVQVVGVLSDPTPLQTRFGYYDYIVYDADDVIRRHLKYIPTPVFIVVDKNGQVRCLHRPTAEDVPESVAKHLKMQVN